MLSNLTSQNHYKEKITNSIYRWPIYVGPENLHIVPKVQGVAKPGLQFQKKQKPLYIAVSNAHVKTLGC